MNNKMVEYNFDRSQHELEEKYVRWERQVDQHGEGDSLD